MDPIRPALPLQLSILNVRPPTRRSGRVGDRRAVRFAVDNSDSDSPMVNGTNTPENGTSDLPSPTGLPPGEVPVSNEESTSGSSTAVDGDDDVVVPELSNLPLASALFGYLKVAHKVVRLDEWRQPTLSVLLRMDDRLESEWKKVMTVENGSAASVDGHDSAVAPAASAEGDDSAVASAAGDDCTSVSESLLGAFPAVPSDGTDANILTSELAGSSPSRSSSL